MRFLELFLVIALQCFICRRDAEHDVKGMSELISATLTHEFGYRSIELVVGDDDIPQEVIEILDMIFICRIDSEIPRFVLQECAESLAGELGHFSLHTLK